MDQPKRSDQDIQKGGGQSGSGKGNEPQHKPEFNNPADPMKRPDHTGQEPHRDIHPGGQKPGGSGERR
jgi:hypothetical protein